MSWRRTTRLLNQPLLSPYSALTQPLIKVVVLAGLRAASARSPHISPYLPVVAQDYELPPHVRAIVITGPNTGGKTVALKNLGLAVLMAKAGLISPHLPPSPPISPRLSPSLAARRDLRNAPRGLFAPPHHTLSSHSLFTPSLHTLSSHPLFTPSPHTLSSHPLFTPSPQTLSSDPLLTPSPHTLSSHPLLTPSAADRCAI